MYKILVPIKSFIRTCVLIKIFVKFLKYFQVLLSRITRNYAPPGVSNPSIIKIFDHSVRKYANKTELDTK